MPRSRARPALAAAMLVVAACHSPADDPRFAVVDLADRRVAKPEAWDALLTRSEPAVRFAAARAAGQTRDVRLAGVIARALAVEQDDAVRAEQYFALGQIGDPASAAVLLAGLDANAPALRAAAAEALGKLGQPRTVATLVAHLTDPAPEVRGATLLAIARVSGRRNEQREPLDAEAASAFLRSTKALLEEIDEGVRWKAAYALAEVEVEGRVPLLKRALHAADATTRFFAVSGLARAAPMETDFLSLVTDPDPYVAAAAVTGLGKVGGEEARAPLLAALQDHSSPSRWHVRRAAVGAMALVDARARESATQISSGVTPTMLAQHAMFGDESLSVRGEAMRVDVANGARLVPTESENPDFASGRWAPPESWFAPSRSSHERVAAIRALAAGAYSQVGPRLLLLARDRDAYVASEALTALESFASAKEKSTLDASDRAQLAEVARAMARASDMAVSASALQLLRSVGSKEDLALIVDAYAALEGDDNAEARSGAVQAAAALAGAAAESFLRTARADPSPAVRGAAHKEWKQLGLADEPAPLPRLSGPPGDRDGGGERPSSVTLVPGRDVLSTAPNPRVVLHFDKGDVEIELLREAAPHHVKMMVERVRDGRCDGLPIHRVVTGFVVQGLDPRGDGWGTGGVFLRDEIQREPFLRGAVGMPNAGPDSGGCQIFVSLVPTPHLDGRFTVFGRVVRGMDVVDALDVGDLCKKAELLP